MRNLLRPAPLALLFSLIAFVAPPLVALGARAGATDETRPQPGGPPTTPVPYHVEFPFLVVDESGRADADVRKDEVSLTDDGAPQTVLALQRDERPASYGLVIDNSGSMRTILDLLVRTGGALVGANRPADEAFVMRFVDPAHTEILEDFTPAKQELIDALSQMYVEGGQTAIIDAVYSAAQHVAEHNADGTHRRAVVLITDGEDRGSRHKPEELFELLRRERVQVFVIGLTGQLDRVGGFVSKSPRERAVGLLYSIAEESGGRAFLPGYDRKGANPLGESVQDIVGHLQWQYEAFYVPSAPPDGKFHKVQIKVAAGKTKRKVIAAPGYYATAAAPKPADKE